MYKKLVLSALVVSTSLMASQYNLKALKITQDITCVIGDFNPPKKENKGFVSNMCYINIGDSIVILDAGPTYIFAKEFYELMHKEYPNKKVSNVVLSNYHDDRIQGASFFKDLGAKIIGHKTINDDIKKNPAKFARMKMIMDKQQLKNTKVILADTLVDDGYKIIGNSKTLTILKPSKIAEERSDIAIYSPDDSFLFVGNMVFNGRMLNYTKHSNVDGWIKALTKLSKLNAKYFLGGHGKEYDKNSYKASLNYLKILKNNVTKAYDEEVDIEDIKLKTTTYKTIKIPYYKQLNYNNISNYYNQLEWSE